MSSTGKLDLFYFFTFSPSIWLYIVPSYFHYELPYIGVTSKETQNKIRDLYKTLCKNTEITLSFNVCKVGSLLSSKSKPPPSLKSSVVYKYCCSSCGACYVGDTTRHWMVSVTEHLLKDKNSHVYQHINKNKECKAKSNETSFKLIDKAVTGTY